MRAYVDTAGERLAIECELPWVADMLAEGAAGQLVSGPAASPSVRVRVEAGRRPFSTRRWQRLGRGAWRRDGEVLVESACTTGFDLHLRCTPEQADFAFRWRPPARELAAAVALRSRFRLLARAVLMQYPVLWWAGTRGRAPLHASACASAHHTPLLTAAGGVGRTTLVLQEVREGAQATGDNIAVADGTSAWGMVEPLRIAGGSGRRMPHGRREVPLLGRAPELVPDRLIVLERGEADRPALTSCTREAAAGALVTSTYMAGELRRYWDFAATLTAGTGIGPPHPPVAEVAQAFAAGLPCHTLILGRTPGPGLTRLLDTVEVAA